MPEKKTKKSPKSKSAAVSKSAPQKRFFKPASKEEIQAVKTGYKKLPSGFTLMVRTFRQLTTNWQLLGGILLVYTLIDIVLVGGSNTNTNLPAAKSSLGGLLHGHVNNLATGFTLFSFLASSGNTSNNNSAGAYESMLLLVISVVFIWALRHVYANKKVRIRDAFYVGTFPMVPFILVLLVMGIQLIPFAIGGSIYTTLVNGGYVIGAPQHLIAVLIFVLLAAWSLYMLCASIIALYIVTLPDMTPLKALRSARQLVRFRRWIVLRKLLFLVVAIAVGGTIVLIPIALFVTPAAMFFFLLLTALMVGVVHSYIYGLYREML
jgi:hypothetical protein